MIDKGLRRLCLIGLALMTAGVLAGCNENERERALQFEKGTYLGVGDTPLSEDQRGALRERAGSQKF